MTYIARSRPVRAWLGLAAMVFVGLPLTIAPRPAAAADPTFNQRMLELINKERAAAGLAPVVANSLLAATAEDAPYLGCGFPVAGRSMDMGVRNYFSHSVLNCGNQSVFNLLNLTGLVYSGAGENIAWVNAVTDPMVAAANLHSQLMASAGHRANILNPSFTSVGVGSWHTAPGQMWSGGGVALPNVYIVTEIFAGIPLGLGATPTTTPTPTTTAAPAPAGAIGGRFAPLSPARILDTRTGIGGLAAVGPDKSVDVQVTGQGGVPATGVAAVAMNVTVTQPSAEGFLTLYPAGTGRPPTSNLNFAPGETVSDLVVVKVGANGRVTAYNWAGNAHVIADVAGWYSETGSGDAGRFEPVVPARIFDARSGLGGAVRIGPGATVDVQVAGRGGVPINGAQAAVLNLTVTGTTASSYVSAYPAGEPRPNASNLNFSAGGTVANRAMVKLGAGGKVSLFNGAGSADLIIDVNGWYTDASVRGTVGAFVPVAPSRILDTRISSGGIVGLIGAGATPSVQVAGRGGVPPSGARAVVLNAVVTGPVTAGYITIFPAGVAQPVASDVNFAAGDTQPNLVVVQLGASGWVNVFSSATTHLIFDVAGWIS
jgi:uncharacterized protein YkwD